MPRPTRKRHRETLDSTIPVRDRGTTAQDAPAIGHRDAKPSGDVTKDASKTSDDDESSLSSLSDDDFEDVPAAKRQKVVSTGQSPKHHNNNADSIHEDDDDDEDDIEFEDVHHVPLPTDESETPRDLELTLAVDNRISLTNPYGDRKGPSKLGRQVRNATHCLHVLFLLWHNTVRNTWICDQEAQAIMMSHLPPSLWDEIEMWREASGLQSSDDQGLRRKKQNVKSAARSEVKGTPARKSRRGKLAENQEEGDGESRDDASSDPFILLLQSLSAWWRRRFRVTAPGLRKWGWMDLDRLDVLVKGYEEDPTNQSRFGERIVGIDGFRHCAQRCEGSRDVGAQLFTALLRVLGIEARMVVSLQPLGFGWNKLEEAEVVDANPVEATDKSNKKSQVTTTRKSPQNTARVARRNILRPTKSGSSRPQRTSAAKSSVVEDEDDATSGEESDTDDSMSDLGLAPQDNPFDKDLEYPHVWTEILSPATLQYIPIDAIVTGVVGTSRDLVEALGPRGAKADKARQITAYIVGFSPDGTAKDVTIRYLKGQVYPGRTKGMRFPVEKMPVYGRDGKAKRYDHFDWFKSVMRNYSRGDAKRPLTDADALEDETDLVALEPQKKEVKAGEETLQYYKDSKEFVLARHLKREEAFKAGAKPVRKFKKGSRGDEDVYLRVDVVPVKSGETWHKQGREPREGEEPLKLVPYRAATLNRKQAIIDAERATGEKVLQGLYSRAQTDWIVPPPIQNGVIPKNDYGNIDLFVPRMCPKGAAHVPYRGGPRVCKRLGIDFAEAVVGFEFGHKMAVPVIHGVVVAKEHRDTVIEELEKDELARQRREDEKRKAKVLGLWRKFLMGLRIVARIKAEYGEISDVGIDVFGKKRAKESKATMRIEIGDEQMAVGDDQEDMAGGFLPGGFEEEEEECRAGEEPVKMGRSSFFPAVDGDDDGEDDLLVDHG